MADLREQFGRPATANPALAGILSPRPTPAPRRTHEEEGDTDPSIKSQIEVAEASPSLAESFPATPTTERSTRRPAGRELRQAPAAQEQRQTHQTVVYISSAARAAAERKRKQDQQANANIVLDALDAMYDDLHELVASRQTTPRSEDSLFPSRRVSQRASSPNTRKVTFTFQATAVELQIMQDMVRDFGAASLSELVAVAMDGYLVPTRNRRR